MIKFFALLTAMAAMLFLATDAFAIDLPQNLKIYGWTVNGLSWEDVEPTVMPSGSTQYYGFNVTMAEGRIFKFRNGIYEYGPGGESGHGDVPIAPDVVAGLVGNTDNNAYVISGDGSEFSITVGVIAGELKVVVRSGFDNFGFTSSGTEFEPGNVPESFNLVGAVGNHPDWTTPGNYIAYSDRDEEAGTVTFKSAVIRGSFAFCGEVSSTSTADGCKSHPSYYGPDADADVNVAFDGAHNMMRARNPKGFVTEEGVYDIVVYFPKDASPWFVMNKTSDMPDDWYFIGDLNNWFNPIFDDPTSGGPGVLDETLLQDKGNWQLEFVGEVSGHGDGWYKFDRFPQGIFSGEFKIFDGEKWEGSFRHVVALPEVDENDPEFASQYKRYHDTPITREQIDADNGLTEIDGEYGDGQNFHIGCNAVYDAVLYFNPDRKKVMLSGQPVDFFIFYGMEPADGDDNDGEVCVKVNKGKPNEDNYFLPGVHDAYKYYDSEGRESRAHMNIDGQNLVAIDLDTATKDDLLAIFNDYNRGIVAAMLGVDVSDLDSYTGTCNKESATLPSGMRLDGYSTIYVAKLPNGFTAAAGPNFTFSFTKALHAKTDYVDDDGNEVHGYSGVHNISNRHMYFFSNSPVHVHVDYSQLASAIAAMGAKMEVSYRVFFKDTKYSTKVLNPADNTTQRMTLYTKSDRIKDTALEDGDRKDFGWIALDHSGWNCNGWCSGHNHAASASQADGGHLWNVAYAPQTEENAPQRSRLNTEFRAPESDQRMNTNNAYNQAHVQYRFDYKYNDGTPIYSVYVPSRLDPEMAEEYNSFNGDDIYAVFKEGGVWTGIEELEAEKFEEPETVPVYYNLQGVRVENPSKGIYIEVRGGKSRKVAL